MLEMDFKPKVDRISEIEAANRLADDVQHSIKDYNDVKTKLLKLTEIKNKLYRDIETLDVEEDKLIKRIVELKQKIWGK